MIPFLISLRSQHDRQVRPLWSIVCSLLLALIHAPAGGQTYHLDSVTGNDSLDGLSPLTAWRTLTYVNGTTFGPGDTILLRRGCSWNNVPLAPRGSGAPGLPIVVASYGEGTPPAIHGGGAVLSAVKLTDQQYWEIQGLEVTNAPPQADTVTRYGVYVLTRNIGVTRHIVLRDLLIHDVSGDRTVKTCGGIFFEVAGSSLPTWFDSVVVEGCDIHDVSPVGIANTSSWATRTLTTNTNWNPSTNVIIRNNNISRIVRNGMIIRVATRPILEHNVLRECGFTESGNALFVFNCDSAIIQYNEAFLTEYNPGDEDAGGFDGDFRCKNTIIQYNYSHDNDFGGVVVVSDGSGATTFNDGAVVRYNVLKNNLHHIIRTSGNVTNTMIYNNTVYSTVLSSVMVIWHKSWGGYADSTHYYNNIFFVQTPASYYNLGGSTNNLFDYNLFFGVHPVSEPSDPHKLIGDPQFLDPASTGNGWSTAAGFRLQPGSPAINSAGTLPGHPVEDYLGNPVPYDNQVDRGAFEYSPSSGVDVERTLPGRALLERVYPNPFNPSATVAFFLERTEDVTLTVHDILGRPVAVLLQGRLAPGRHVANFDGERLSAGMYFCILQTETAMESQRLILLR